MQGLERSAWGGERNRPFFDPPVVAGTITYHAWTSLHPVGCCLWERNGSEITSSRMSRGAIGDGTIKYHSCNLPTEEIPNINESLWISLNYHRDLVWKKKNSSEMEKAVTTGWRAMSPKSKHDFHDKSIREWRLEKCLIFLRSGFFCVQLFCSFVCYRTIQLYLPMWSGDIHVQCITGLFTNMAHWCHCSVALQGCLPVLLLFCVLQDYFCRYSHITSLLCLLQGYLLIWSCDRPHCCSCYRGIYQTVPVYGASSSVERSFQEGRHYIEYKAVDEAGNFDSCSFSVQVDGKTWFCFESHSFPGLAVKSELSG